MVLDSKCGSHGGIKFGRHGEVKAQSETKARSLWSRMTFRRSVSDSGSESGSDINAVIGGTPASVFGQFGEIIIFMEPLLDSQVQSLFKLGTVFILLLFYETMSYFLCISLNFEHCGLVIRENNFDS